MSLKSRLVKIVDPVVRWKNYQFPDFRADGVSASGKNVSFLSDPAFEAAWCIAEVGNREGWKGKVPNIRWRAHVACWAADNARHLDGDFVECGVFTGILSMTVMHYLRNKYGAGVWKQRQFYLFDTFNGIPVDPNGDARDKASIALNNTLYFDCYKLAERNFAQFDNARLVKGILPDAIDQVAGGLRKISYLSIDLNHASAERATIERLWPLLVPGALVVIDDYAAGGHELQFHAWNDFAATRNVGVLTLPTGQGLLLKPPAGT